MTRQETRHFIAGLETARERAVSILLKADGTGEKDAGQRRAARRIIAEITRDIEEYSDHLACWSEDCIDEGLRA